MKIKAYVGYDERRGRRYWREFELLDKLPEVGGRFGPVEGEEGSCYVCVELPEDERPVGD